MKRVVRSTAAAASLGLITAAIPAISSGGELPPPAPQAALYAPAAPAIAPGLTTYRFCMPYPYYGPTATPCAPPSGFTHYNPGYGGYVYPGYAYAGYGASGYFPGPFATGAVAGLLLGAHIF